MSTTTTVTTSLTTIAEIQSQYAEFLGFAIVNGATALNAFQVEAQVSAAAPWVPIKTTGYTDAWGTSPAWATANLTTLGASGEAVLAVLGKHWQRVRLRASVASGTSDVTVYASAGA